jgi:SAM-dependent methyltransferase
VDITSKEYWQKQYRDGNTGWNIGHVSFPIKEYFEQVSNKDIRILIPGAGNAYEAEYLYECGFKNVYVLDIASEPLQNLSNSYPDFPKGQLIEADFFKHQGQYDLVLEQTFFSALPITKREEYVQQIHRLLKDNGKLVGLLFDLDFGNTFPPFGGNKEIYTQLFSNLFKLKTLEKAHNSIKPRANNELFIIFEKK